MKRYTPSPAILLILLFINVFSNRSSGQGFNPFETGEIVLNNSEVLKGFIWITDQLNGPKLVYFKPTLYSLSSKYSAFDLISVTLKKGNKIYISEGVPTENGTARKLVEVHFKGDYSLLSYRDSKELTYYIFDSFGGITELKNSFTVPDKTNRYSIQFNNEYKLVLNDLFNNDTKITDDIESTSFTSKSLSSLLRKYHLNNNLDYNIYPPPAVTTFIGGGASVAMLKHLSEINEDFISTSPFGAITLFAGLLTPKDFIEIRAEASLLYGIIYHDDNYAIPWNMTVYYEDITKTTILSNSFIIGINPIKWKSFSTTFSAGATYNTFLNYSRSVTEEILQGDLDIVENYYYDDFMKPESFFSGVARAGINYDLNKSNSFRITYGYTKYFSDEPGFMNLNTGSISYLHKIF